MQFVKSYGILLKYLGGVAHLGERLNGIQEVVGSIPIISTRKKARRQSCFFVLSGRGHLGLTLLPHSGVSLVFAGIAVSVLEGSAPEYAPLIQGTIAAAAVINEIIAVFMAKKGFEWAGELGQAGKYAASAETADARQTSPGKTLRHTRKITGRHPVPGAFSDIERSWNPWMSAEMSGGFLPFVICLTARGSAAVVE